jgi:hypothetical protein
MWEVTCLLSTTVTTTFIFSDILVDETLKIPFLLLFCHHQRINIKLKMMKKETEMIAQMPGQVTDDFDVF